MVSRGSYELDGWILKPADFDEKRSYPAILDIHGGPKTAYGEVFFHEMQFWAAQGYIVFSATRPVPTAGATGLPICAGAMGRSTMRI